MARVSALVVDVYIVAVVCFQARLSRPSISNRVYASGWVDGCLIACRITSLYSAASVGGVGCTDVGDVVLATRWMCLQMVPWIRWSQQAQEYMCTQMLRWVHSRAQSWVHLSCSRLTVYSWLPSADFTAHAVVPVTETNLYI